MGDSVDNSEISVREVAQTSLIFDSSTTRYVVLVFRTATFGVVLKSGLFTIEM